jgi:hypothetical protein
MGKRKKRPIDMTDDELIKKMFPKEVVKRLKEIAHEKDDKSSKKSPSQG